MDCLDKHTYSGERLKELRIAAGLNQSELAKRLKVSRQSVSRWECDKSRPNAEITAALCTALGVEYDALFGDISAACAECGAAESDDASCEGGQVDSLVERVDEVKRIKGLLRRYNVAAAVGLGVLAGALALLAAFGLIFLVTLISVNSDNGSMSVAVAAPSTAEDLFVLCGIVIWMAICGVVNGAIYASKHPVGGKKNEKKN